MSEVVRRRGRPRKDAEEIPKQDENVQVDSVEESPQQAKIRQSKEVKKAREAITWVGQKYYIAQPKLKHNGRPDKKIILIREKSNGTKYRTFVCWESKEPAFVERLKKEGLLVNG